MRSLAEELKVVQRERGQEVMGIRYEIMKVHAEMREREEAV